MDQFAVINNNINNDNNEVQPQQQQMASLYVGDLHPDVVDDDLRNAFIEFESLASVKVVKDFITNNSLCYGFVNFHSTEDAVKAISSKNNTPIYGKAIRVMWSSRGSQFRKNGEGNIFVKNLDKSVDNNRLKEMFTEFGNILSCKVSMYENGTSKGFGFVQFETQDAADFAIKSLNGKNVDGKNINVAPFIPKALRSVPSPDAPYTNLYVKNLELDLTQEKLSEMFSKFGKIVSIGIPTDENGSSKGFGFVCFDKADDARHAVEAMNGVELGSKTLYVGKAQKKAERLRTLRQQFEEKRKEKIEKYKNCNVYVKNIDESVNEDMLRELFSQCGTITSVKLMLHPKGCSRGVGFVCFSTPEEADKAVRTFFFYMFHGKPLYVAIAQRKEERQAQLRMQYGQQSTLYKGPAVPPVTTGLFYPAPPAIYAPHPPHPGIIYGPPMGIRPGSRGSTFNPAAIPAFQTHRLPMYGPPKRWMNGNPSSQGYPKIRDFNFQINGKAKYQFNRHGHEFCNGLQPLVPYSAELTSFVAAADPSQQKIILGQKLFPLVCQHQPNFASKITGMLLEMETTELLLLIDSPPSLAEKVNEALNVITAANTKEANVASVLAAEVVN